MPFFISGRVGVSGHVCSCCVFLLYAVALPCHSIATLILNRQIYNKMEINGSQACHWVVYYHWKPPGTAMALITTAA